MVLGHISPISQTPPLPPGNLLHSPLDNTGTTPVGCSLPIRGYSKYGKRFVYVLFMVPKSCSSFFSSYGKSAHLSHHNGMLVVIQKLN